jgi:sulfate transporter 4
LQPESHPPPTRQTHLRDFLVWVTAFLCTLFLGVELGLGISIGLALLIVILESAFPHTAVLGQIERSAVYRCGGGAGAVQAQSGKSEALPGSAACPSVTELHATHSPPHRPALDPATPRNIEQYPQSELVPGVLVVRLDAPVYFANVQYMRDKLDEYEAEAQA